MILQYCLWSFFTNWGPSFGKKKEKSLRTSFGWHKEEKIEWKSYLKGKLLYFVLSSTWKHTVLLITTYSPLSWSCLPVTCFNFFSYLFLLTQLISGKFSCKWKGVRRVFLKPLPRSHRKWSLSFGRWRWCRTGPSEYLGEQLENSDRNGGFSHLRILILLSLICLNTATFNLQFLSSQSRLNEHLTSQHSSITSLVLRQLVNLCMTYTQSKLLGSKLQYQDLLIFKFNRAFYIGVFVHGLLQAFGKWKVCSTREAPALLHALWAYDVRCGCVKWCTVICFTSLMHHSILVWTWKILQLFSKLWNRKWKEGRKSVRP